VNFLVGTIISVNTMLYLSLYYLVNDLVNLHISNHQKLEFVLS